MTAADRLIPVVLMSNANALELLPPRDTAPPAKSASSADRSKQTDKSKPGDSDQPNHFKTKLAKKLNALKDQATTAKPADETSKPAQATSPDQAEKDAALAEQEATKTPVTAKPKVTKPVVEETEQVAEKPAVKPKAVPATSTTTDPTAEDKADKSAPTNHKTAASNSTKTPVVDANAAAQVATPVKPATTDTSTADSTGDANADPNAVDGVSPSTASPFGSGKVLAKAAAGAGNANTATSTDATQQGDAQAVDALASADPAVSADPAAEIAQTVVKAVGESDTGDSTASVASAMAGTDKVSLGTNTIKGATAAAPTPQAQFVETNQPKIVSSIQGQLMPHGGTMQIRLDPPELGPMQVSVHMKDGVMTASFETTSDHATKLLSHTLSQLKSGLEAAGMNVEKLQVQQSTKRDANPDSNGDSGNAPQEQQQQAQQEKQRREMVQRMWQKLAGGDPLDMVA